MQLFWKVADGFAKRRLLVALALVAGGALLAAGTPIALEVVIDSLEPHCSGGVAEHSNAPYRPISLVTSC